MKIGIVGLGLIGGSLAKAFKFSEKVTVYGCDKNQFTTQIAMMSDFIDDDLTGRESECDFIFIAINAKNTVEYVKTHANCFKDGAIVIDCCGVKSSVCEPCFEIASNHNFHFVGGHPMAGTQFSGLKYSKQDLFVGQNMVLVPKSDEDVGVLQKIKDTLTIAGFSSVSVTTAKKHDEVIAFTSQLAHVVSNAYVKSPNAIIHKGFSAGSYRDLTRVAWLNPQMWAELFLSNRENILLELNHYITSLKAYQDAITNSDKEKLIALLEEGKRCKEEVDG